MVGSTAVLAGAYFGVVNVGADDPHFPAVHAFLTMARDRSIEVRSRDIEVPNLDDQALIRAGVVNPAAAELALAKLKKAEARGVQVTVTRTSDGIVVTTSQPKRLKKGAPPKPNLSKGLPKMAKRP